MVVAHATVLRLTTSPTASRLLGGIERRPMKTFSNSLRRLNLAWGSHKARAFASPAIRGEPSEREGEHLRMCPVPPCVPPPVSLSALRGHPRSGIL